MKTRLPNHRRSVVEVAAILRVSARTIQRLVKAGDLRASNDGAIADDDLRAFLDSRLTQKKENPA